MLLIQMEFVKRICVQAIVPPALKISKIRQRSVLHANQIMWSTEKLIPIDVLGINVLQTNSLTKILSSAKIVQLAAMNVHKTLVQNVPAARF